VGPTSAVIPGPTNADTDISSSAERWKLFCEPCRVPFGMTNLVWPRFGLCWVNSLLLGTSERGEVHRRFRVTSVPATPPGFPPRPLGPCRPAHPQDGRRTLTSRSDIDSPTSTSTTAGLTKKRSSGCACPSRSIARFSPQPSRATARDARTSSFHTCAEQLTASPTTLRALKRRLRGSVIGLTGIGLCRGALTCLVVGFENSASPEQLASHGDRNGRQGDCAHPGPVEHPAGGGVKRKDP
jgi:hypothetical protein